MVIGSVLTRKNTAMINAISGLLQMVFVFILLGVFLVNGKIEFDFGYVFMIFPTFIGYIGTIYNVIEYYRTKQYYLDHMTAFIGNSIFIIFFVMAYLGIFPMALGFVFIIPSFAITSIGAALELLPN
jgi:hypothetical protein